MKNKKALVSIAYILVAIVIVIYHNQVLTWVEQEHKYDWLILSTVAVVIALVPIMPYGVIGALIGAKYGVIIGGFINVLCSTIAGIIIFILIRYVFQRKGRQIIDKYKYTASFTLLIERYPFFAILIGRLIPIMPAIVINSYTAMSKISLIKFAIATLVGKVPVMLLFALLGNQLVNSPYHVALTIVVYCLFLLIVFVVYRWTTRAKVNE